MWVTPTQHSLTQSVLSHSIRRNASSCVCVRVWLLNRLLFKFVTRKLSFKSLLCEYIKYDSQFHSPHSHTFKFKFIFPSTSGWQIHEMKIYLEIKLIKKKGLPAANGIPYTHISFVSHKSHGALRAADKIRAKIDVCRRKKRKNVLIMFARIFSFLAINYIAHVHTKWEWLQLTFRIYQFVRIRCARVWHTHTHTQRRTSQKLRNTQKSITNSLGARACRLICFYFYHKPLYLLSEHNF